MKRRRFKSLLREPLLHFLLLGGLLFAGQQFIWQTPELLQVTAAEQTRIAQAWRRQTGRTPSAPQMQALLDQHIREQLLLREAMRLQLGRGDRVVQTRLVKNLQFAQGDSYAPPENIDDYRRQFETALDLGMAEHDIVVQRRLVQRMRQHIHSQVRVSEADLKQWYAQHAEEFAQPARYRLQHVFFNKQRGETSARMAADNALTRLRAGTPAPAIASDPYLWGTRFSGTSREQLAAQLGRGIADAVERSHPGRWSGPVASFYGQHLIHVESIADAKPLAYEVARPRVVAAVYAAKETAALDDAITVMRQRYAIRVDDWVPDRPTLALGRAEP